MYIYIYINFFDRESFFSRERRKGERKKEKRILYHSREININTCVCAV